MKQTLSNADLQKIWAKWMSNFEGQPISGLQQRLKYDNQHRHYGLAQRFETWLFSQGAVVKQVNGKRHLEFMTPEQATWFILKWL